MSAIPKIPVMPSRHRKWLGKAGQSEYITVFIVIVTY